MVRGYPGSSHIRAGARHVRVPLAAAGLVVGVLAGGGLGANSAHAAPAGASPDRPVPAGTYTYATGGRFDYGGIDSYPATTRVRWDAPASGVQRSQWDQRAADGFGAVDDTGVSYWPDGVHLVYANESWTDPTGNYAYDCRAVQPQQAPLIVPGHPRAGQRFNVTIPCNGYTEAYTITVMAPQSVSVGDQQVKAVVLKSESSWAGGGYSGSGSSTYWLLPGTDLMLREVATYGEQAYGLPYYSQNETAQLKSLRPQ